ncbi:ABC transporter permease [Streptomyces sp. NPDC088341]|uniref:ABC transporter permease n=1 Tax=Streptomyces sp. NPDC088341 TaxID=3154870 RepID=UPI00342D6A84
MSAPATTRRMIAVMVLVPVAVALALWVFAWPAARIAPQDLPVGIAGPATATAQLEKGFGQREGAFEVHRYADEAAARQAIEDRVVYGAVVAAPEGTRLLTATAAGPMVAQFLTQAVTAQAPAGAKIPVTDVVPTPAGDARGSVLGASVLPLSMAGIATGAVVTLLGLRGARAAVTLAGAAALVGIAATAVAGSWLEAITGDWWTEAGAIGLTVLAMSAGAAGLAALLGRAGLGLGGLLMVFLGNSFSGVTSAPEMLPEPIGLIGQLLPPGAGGSLIRSVAFFDGAGAGASLLTLSVWVVLGLSAVLVGARVRRPAPAAVETRAAEPALVG